jgi:tyrosyl-tRNA synthetase
MAIEESDAELLTMFKALADESRLKIIGLLATRERSVDELATTLKLKPRDAKAALARRLVTRLHGEEAAALAEADFDRKFRQRDLPEFVADRHASKPDDLVGTLVEVEFAKTRGDAKRLIDQGGVRVNGEKASSDTTLHDGDVLQAGKRSFVRIRLR